VPLAVGLAFGIIAFEYGMDWTLNKSQARFQLEL
jgi:hypothetical protein